MAMSYRLTRMEPQPTDIPGHPEVIGRLDVDPGAPWPPVVALFIDVGNTSADQVEAFVDAAVGSLRGLFPPGSTLFVPVRDGRGTHIYRLEPEGPTGTVAVVAAENAALRSENDELRERISYLEDRLEDARWAAMGEDL